MSATRALTDGFDLAFAIGAQLCIGAAAVAAVSLRARTAAPVTQLPHAREADEQEAVAA